MDGQEFTLGLDAPDLTSLKVYRDYLKSRESATLGQKTGPFSFSFYVFDFSANAEGKYLLDSEDRKLIKEHRIYLY
jgi:hypothetical protein